MKLVQTLFKKELSQFFNQFQDVTHHTVNIFIASLKVREYLQNDIIFDYQDKGNEFYIIMDGEVRILFPVK